MFPIFLAVPRVTCGGGEPVPEGRAGRGGGGADEESEGEAGGSGRRSQC